MKDNQLVDEVGYREPHPSSAYAMPRQTWDQLRAAGWHDDQIGAVAAAGITDLALAALQLHQRKRTADKISGVQLANRAQRRAAARATRRRGRG